MFPHVIKLHVYIIAFILCFFSELISKLPVQAQGLTTDLSRKDVPIDWNFTGTSILLFGAIEKLAEKQGKLDVVIVVKGPDRTINVRKKERIAGIWVNTKSKSYREAPAFYSIVSSRPLSSIAKQTDLEHMGIGFKTVTLNLAQSHGKLINGKPDQYSVAIVRLMQRDGLYNEVPDGVSLIGRSLFRADIKLPSNVPVGNFHTDVYLFHDGQLVSLSSRPLRIQKQGFEQSITWLAYDYPLAYGVLAVLIAIFAGLVATAVFKDD